jgi:TusA-related sulfurtransferase
MAVKPVGVRGSQSPQQRDVITNTATEQPDEIFDAGDLGCGDGPLIRIAAILRSMSPGAVLEVRSADPGVIADLPAWCRMVGHTYLGSGEGDNAGRHLVRRRED